MMSSLTHSLSKPTISVIPILPLLDSYIKTYCSYLQNYNCYTKLSSSAATLSRSMNLDTSLDAFSTYLSNLSSTHLLIYSSNILLLTYHSLVTIELLLQSSIQFCDAIISNTLIPEKVSFYGNIYIIFKFCSFSENILVNFYFRENKSRSPLNIQKNIEEMLPLYYMHSDYQVYIYATMSYS